MPTSKKKASSSKSSATSQSADLASATKAVQQAVARAVKTKQIPATIRGPIFCGIWFNPITRKIEVINQLDAKQFG
jgi:hypothetical protein